MTNTTETTFKKKCQILSDLWVLHRENEKYKEQFYFSDLGYPLAYCIAEKLIVGVGPEAKKIIEETFDWLLDALKKEDIGYDNLKSLIDEVQKVYV